MKAYTFLISMILFNLLLIGGIMGQDNSYPPVLMQPGFSPPPPPQAPTPVPPPAPVPPRAPLAPPPPGTPVVQFIPQQTLMVNLQTALITAQKVSKLLQPGKVWMTRGPGGELEIKAGLIYRGIVVDVLRFSPVDGRILPRGLNPRAMQSTISLESVKNSLKSVIENLNLAATAEYREPEACWVFPLTLKGATVAGIKIYYDGIQVVQDYAGTQEMNFYGQ